ncbi:hypothetical protein LTR17_026197 [Elasticomyces elasticus]|nr:hypothetical protein LTR17_026197 [Elasticomyces elasticus]
MPSNHLNTSLPSSLSTPLVREAGRPDNPETRFEEDADSETDELDTISELSSEADSSDEHSTPVDRDTSTLHSTTSTPTARLLPDTNTTPDRSIDSAMVPPSTQPARSHPPTLSKRAMKQGEALDKHLSSLRASDRANLTHLPPAQQRALLLSQLGQLENAKRAENHQRGNLESKGNLFGCQRKTWLVRVPPHFGNVRSLKH